MRAAGRGAPSSSSALPRAYPTARVMRFLRTAEPGEGTPAACRGAAPAAAVLLLLLLLTSLPCHRGQKKNVTCAAPGSCSALCSHPWLS